MSYTIFYRPGKEAYRKEHASFFWPLILTSALLLALYSGLIRPQRSQLEVIAQQYQAGQATAAESISAFCQTILGEPNAD